MAEFFREKTIKRTAREHYCAGCNRKIEAGSPASYFACKDEGEFYSGHYHLDCREAEIAWNDLNDTWWDDYSPLYSLPESDNARGPDGDIAWICEKYPDVAARLNIATLPQTEGDT